MAVLGSVLAQVYRGQLSPHLAGLPAGARSTATQSIAETQAIAQRLGPAGSHLLTAADGSFVHAMHVTSLISLIIALLGAVVMAIWMPGRTAAAPERPVPVRPEQRDEVLVDG